MTTLADLDVMDATTPPMIAPAKPKPHRHQWSRLEVAFPVYPGEAGYPTPDVMPWTVCTRCGTVRDEAAARRGRNNRKRGGGAELASARLVGGRKVGPLGHPWDVEMPGYARLQVRKYATPQGLRKIAAELARIGSGPEMPGYIWLEPGRGGEQLIVFRLRDFAERHGLPGVDE